jgi:hypothetical protein
MTHRLTVAVLGCTVLDVELSRAPVLPTAPPVEQAPTGDPGPVTERRTGPVLGFAVPPRPGRNVPGVIR